MENQQKYMCYVCRVAFDKADVISKGINHFICLNCLDKEQEAFSVINKEDLVNHPSHYTAYKGIEVIQLTEQMNFNRGNAIKYIARAGLKHKDKEVEDLQKAIWYIKREIQRIQKE